MQRRSSSGGSEGLGIHRTYPYPAYGGLGPVPGGQGEQRDDIANPVTLYGNRVEKGLKYGFTLK